MITQGTDGLSRVIWSNGFNTYFKYFAVEVFLPALLSLSLSKWALSHIEIHEESAPWWNVETNTSSWEPKTMMHINTLWVLSPGISRQCFTASIMVWVEFPLG
jgi:hypothetical protein